MDSLLLEFLLSNGVTSGQKDIIKYLWKREIDSIDTAIGMGYIATDLGKSINSVGRDLKGLVGHKVVGVTSGYRNVRYYLPMLVISKMKESIDSTLSYDSELNRRDNAGKPAQE